MRQWSVRIMGVMAWWMEGSMNVAVLYCALRNIGAVLVRTAIYSPLFYSELCSCCSCYYINFLDFAVRRVIPYSMTSTNYLVSSDFS